MNAAMHSSFSQSPGNPTILVVNVHSSQNAGDAALLEMNLHQLRSAFGSPHFLISANYPEEPFFQEFADVEVVPSAFSIVRNNQGVSVPQQMLQLGVGVSKMLFGAPARSKPVSQARHGWDHLMAACQQADLVVAVSGNQFLSMGKYGWPFPLTAFPVWAAHCFKKPFYVMPQSIGPFKRGWERAAFRYLYGKARRVYLRDQVSIDLARALGLQRAYFAPDPAFALPSAGQAQAETILARYGHQRGQPALGLTVIAPLSRALNASNVFQNYYQSLAAALHTFIAETGAQVFIFNQVTGPTMIEDDRRAGQALLELLPEDRLKVTLVDQPLTAAELKACYRCMNLMVASRLHSGIFAMGAGVPTLLIGYFTKSRGLMQSMGLQDWVIELNQIKPELVSQKLRLAWQQREALSAAVLVKAGEYADQVLRLGNEIREDFESGGSNTARRSTD